MIRERIRKNCSDRMKTRTKYILSIIIVFGIVNYFGIMLHFFEKDFFESFDYPLNEDITPYIDQLKNNDRPSVQPINSYNYTFSKTAAGKCKDLPSVRLVIIVKSAMDHFARRSAIRNSFGFERRFSDVLIRTVFLLGSLRSKHPNSLQKDIDKESERYNDIVQIDFVDNYFNNTIKTMMGFQWVMKYCPNSKFYLFSDDDMYVSVKNVLRFVRNPSHYPEYVEEILNNDNHTLNAHRVKRHIQNNYDLPDDVILYSGFMFVSSPHRHKSSKWYISLEEYPWHMWPPYISAGAYLLSKEALSTMYYASFYTAHFRFDDIYLGILAKKSGITPFHCKEFYFYKKDYNSYNYRYVIASHGYDDPAELLKVWNEQRAAGNA
ncbi:beta-1,3-galactosyltransferase brn-like isoform X2 [Arctopsyche grandis]|uniref:beta-1,3-galactosyltransferase brn-like isoform X2 n=1 Tax=Arctopsyche grandis TaxID=121162 RepID=UPI00406D86BA